MNSNTNVILVQPPPSSLREKRDIPTCQHLGLGYLASSLESKGFYTKVIDAKLRRLDFKELLSIIKKENPTLIGLTAMTHEINRAAKVAEAIKKVFKGVTIVIGGVHVSALPVETMKYFSIFDLAVIGEGEETIIEIADSINNDKDFSKIKGIAFRVGSEIKLTPSRLPLEDVDKLHFPAWHQFKEAMDYRLITSRGCPYKCIFCMRASGSRPRMRSPENVVKEIENVISERKPRNILFSDETFTFDKERTRRICDLIKERGLNKKIRWSATTRVDCITKELLQTMKNAGCWSIEFGVESGNAEVLKKTKKNITLEQAERAVGFAKDVGLYIETDFILGHPNETKESAIDTINFGAKLNANIMPLGIMVPYPGTEVADMAIRGEGGYRIISYDWAEYNKQLGNAMEIESLSRQDLERLQLIGYLKLFIYNRRYIDLLKFIMSFHREALAYVKNVFCKKGQIRKKPTITISEAIRILFDRKLGDK